MAALKGFKHPCQLCDLKISSQSNLKNHKMSVHVGVKYQCNQCDFKFTKQGNLKRHKISIHGGNLKLHKMSLFWISLLIQKRSFREDLKKAYPPNTIWG